jgi:hypothetical protein
MTATTNSYQGDELDWDSSGWSDRRVSYSLQLHRRSAVDLVRVASALCPRR